MLPCGGGCGDGGLVRLLRWWGEEGEEVIAVLGSAVVPQDMDGAVMVVVEGDDSSGEDGGRTEE